MTSHWKTLDLDPAHATERDVKRAYARLLKKCRPDQDLEGFRMLHDAYQMALGELEWQSRTVRFPASDPSSGSEDMDPVELSTVEPDRSFPVLSHVAVSPAVATLREVLACLEDALENQNPDVAERVRNAEAALFENPDEAACWGDGMHRLMVKYGDHPDLRLKPEAILFELEHHSVSATIAVIDRFDQKENREGINRLAKLLLANKHLVKTPAGAIAASRLACVAASGPSGHVGPLADFAYENLARGERDFHMQLIDRYQFLGEILSNVPVSQRAFWRRRMMNPSGEEGWDDEASVSALRWLGSNPGRQNPAFDTLWNLLPEMVADSVGRAKRSIPADRPAAVSETSGGGENFSWEAAPPRQKPRHTVRYRQSEFPKRRGFPFYLLGLLILPLFRLLNLNDSATSPQFQNYPTSVPRARDLKLVTYEDLMKLKAKEESAPEESDLKIPGKKKEPMTPGSSGDADPSTNPLLKLFQESQQNHR